MFALLLAAALSQPAPAQPQPVTVQPVTVQPVTVDFGAAGQVTVPRPGKMGDFEPTDKTYLSPRGDAAAVQFCWDVPTMSPLMCQVNLVRSSGQILTLKEGAVGPLLWTPDGQYLIGAGNNTMRLWNLVGGSRTHAPQAPNNEIDAHSKLYRIQRIWLQDRFLCVAAWGRRYSKARGPSEISVTTRYALPALRPLETVVSPTSEFAEAACQPPHTEP